MQIVIEYLVFESQRRVIRRIRRGRATSTVDHYRRPRDLTPFNLLVFLKRIYSDDQLPLTDNERKSLVNTIGDLERQYFAPDTRPSATSEDLEKVLADWLPRATNGRIASNGSP